MKFGKTWVTNMARCWRNIKRNLGAWLAVIGLNFILLISPFISNGVFTQQPEKVMEYVAIQLSTTWVLWIGILFIIIVVTTMLLSLFQWLRYKVKNRNRKMK